MRSTDPSTTVQRRRLAVVFMNRTMTDRLHMAEQLGVHEGLPERTNEASFEILRRVRETGQIPALVDLLYPSRKGSGMPGGEHV